MSDSTHPYDKATGGKGDRDIRTDPKKYREALFWQKRDARLKATCICGKPLPCHHDNIVES